ncbi:MAG: hypothetical protein ACXWIN_03375, partial [Burkholderiaceae bacterium]
MAGTLRTAHIGRVPGEIKLSGNVVSPTFLAGLSAPTTLYRIFVAHAAPCCYIGSSLILRERHAT